MEVERSLLNAERLLQQNRYAEALKELRSHLATDPESIPALIMLAQVHLGLDEHEKADAIADQLIAKNPSDAEILFLKGITQTQLGKRKNALKYLNSALAFNPLLAQAHGLKASIYYQDADFEKALESANEGLRIDPHNSTCLNFRSMALLRLDRKEEHVNANEQALRNNPMDATTHASVGFSALKQGEYDKAKDHFREALRIDPNNNYARYGMLEAIKATNWYYRLFLKYALWMQGLRPQVRWAVIIIGYLMVRYLDGNAEKMGSFEPVARIIVNLYLVFAISTWIIGPVSNIFLRFHSFGKFVLKEREVQVANLCAVLLTLAMVGAVMMYVFAQEPQWWNMGLYVLCSGIALTVVVSSIETRTLEKSRRRLKTVGMIFAIACGVLILSAVVLPVFAMRLLDVLAYAFVGYQFYANSQE